MAAICWIIAILALCNAARLKHNEAKHAKKMRKLIETAIVAAAKNSGKLNEQRNFKKNSGKFKEA